MRVCNPEPLIFLFRCQCVVVFKLNSTSLSLFLANDQEQISSVTIMWHSCAVISHARRTNLMMPYVCILDSNQQLKIQLLQYLWASENMFLILKFPIQDAINLFGTTIVDNGYSNHLKACQNWKLFMLHQFFSELPTLIQHYYKPPQSSKLFISQHDTIFNKLDFWSRPTWFSLILRVPPKTSEPLVKVVYYGAL